MSLANASWDPRRKLLVLTFAQQLPGLTDCAHWTASVAFLRTTGSGLRSVALNVQQEG